MTIRVGVLGAAGKMGRTVCAAVTEADGLELVAGIDPGAAGQVVEGVTLVGTLDDLDPESVDVLVDFTHLVAGRDNLAWAARHGVHAVVGTTGFSGEDLARFDATFAAASAGCLIAPNFAIGAVLMMRFAELAAPWFDSAEVVELHHDAKKDAPSGTAVATAQRMAAASDRWGADPTETVVVDGARGGSVGGVGVHSLRVRGMVAHQEVILGTAGQTLTIRHDSYDRVSFMPGVVESVRRIVDRTGLIVGLDKLLGLD